MLEIKLLRIIKICIDNIEYFDRVFIFISMCIKNWYIGNILCIKENSFE